MLNVLVAQVRLQGARIVPLVGQGKAAGMVDQLTSPQSMTWRLFGRMRIFSYQALRSGPHGIPRAFSTAANASASKSSWGRSSFIRSVTRACVRPANVYSVATVR